MRYRGIRSLTVWYANKFANSHGASERRDCICLSGKHWQFIVTLVDGTLKHSYVKNKNHRDIIKNRNICLMIYHGWKKKSISSRPSVHSSKCEHNLLCWPMFIFTRSQHRLDQCKIRNWSKDDNASTIVLIGPYIHNILTVSWRHDCCRQMCTKCSSSQHFSGQRLCLAL